MADPADRKALSIGTDGTEEYPDMFPCPPIGIVSRKPEKNGGVLKGLFPLHYPFKKILDFS